LVGTSRRRPYCTGFVSRHRSSSPSRIHRWIVSRLTPSWRASALLLAPWSRSAARTRSFSTRSFSCVAPSRRRQAHHLIAGARYGAAGDRTQSRKRCLTRTSRRLGRSRSSDDLASR
jgi:hypothetical protein